MKTKTMYVCEFCNKTYDLPKDALMCEAECLGLTIKQYKEYLRLLKEEHDAFQIASCKSNNDTRKACDYAIKNVLDFQKKYNFADKR